MLKDLINGIWNRITKPKHIQEQASTRMAICQPCLENGSCLVCGCKTPEMFYAENKVCPKNKWGAMQDEFTWNNNLNHFLHFIEGYTELEYDPSIINKAKIVARKTKVQGKVSYFIKNNKLYIYEHRD